MFALLQRWFGNRHTREIKRMSRTVQAINALEPRFQALSDESLRETTQGLRARLSKGETLDALLPEAFAAVRESARRVRKMRHFDVQLIGGMALHEGRIAEMKTGEGKTLMSTLAAYLNALPGKGVHIVTVNEYLAKRDRDWMGPIFEALGLTVGVIRSEQPRAEKQAAYLADITYGTNNEYGFDYLRDNMAFSGKDRVQRARHYAIVDEVDSILIDEARTPLIISGPAEESTDLYSKINLIIPRLKRETLVEDQPELGGVEGDYVIDEKNRQVELTERGHEKVEAELIKAGLLAENDSLYAATNLSLLQHALAGLKAHTLFKRDVEYIVQNNQVVIVDEHTGRIMPGRRWSDGLHQAIEAKENVPIQRETQTYASTTFQNYFRLYSKLAGMTGTADTEAFEFNHIYGLNVLVIPTHRPMVRNDENDLVYLTIDEKYDAVIQEIERCRELKRPVLVGTASVESSERLSKALQAKNIAHNVLNAKFHQKEAEIIADAGRPGALTIATNMAGRGTDIVLGGNLEAEKAALGPDADPEALRVIEQEWQKRHDQVIATGGLHIIGTERHESRRIDNQLRGRAGRQGDPGSSRFFLSMEDDLMRRFASDFVRNIMKSLGMEKGEAIEAKMVSNAIARAQRQVEQHNFDIRKNLLEYDDVANDQRQIIYAQRNELMEATDISDTIAVIREEVVDELISQYVPPQSLEEQWDLAGLEGALENEFGSRQSIRELVGGDKNMTEDQLRKRVLDQIVSEYAAKEAQFGPEIRIAEKQVMLQVLDQLWKEHLATMDHLRMGIGLRSYAQKQPKQEYKREAFLLFQTLLGNVKRDVVRFLSRLRIQTQEEVEAIERQRREALLRQAQLVHMSSSGLDDGTNGAAEGLPSNTDEKKADTYVRDVPKVGRNALCPCGSGKKYKQCHGRVS